MYEELKEENILLKKNLELAESHIGNVSGSLFEPSFTEITNAENEAYKQAGENAYFGNGFRAGVKWMYDRVKEAKSFEPTDEQIEKASIDCVEDYHISPDSGYGNLLKQTYRTAINWYKKTVKESV